MSKQNVYFDNNGTTRLHPGVVRIIKQTLDIYGNPSSKHYPGREIKEYINKISQLVHSYGGLLHTDAVRI